MKLQEDRLVSIVIPSFNGERYLAETLESCLRQTYRNIEIIVVDDGSSDNSVKIAKSFAASDATISVFENKNNLGISANCNKGFHLSAGCFVLFLGHDDKLPEDHIAKITSEFDDSTAFVHCNSIHIDGDGNEIKVKKDDKLQIKKTDNILYELSRSNFISSCGLIINREFFDKVGGYDCYFWNFYEWLTWIKLAKLGNVKYSVRSKAFYRKHDTNITKTFKGKKVIRKLHAYKKHCRSMAYEGSRFSLKQKVLYFCKLIKQEVRYKIRMTLS